MLIFCCEVKEQLPVYTYVPVIHVKDISKKIVLKAQMGRQQLWREFSKNSCFVGMHYVVKTCGWHTMPTKKHDGYEMKNVLNSLRV